MSDFLNSIAHVVVEYIMDEKPPKPVTEPAPIVPLTEEEHSALLARMYVVLIALIMIVSLFIKFR